MKKNFRGAKTEEAVLLSAVLRDMEQFHTFRQKVRICKTTIDMHTDVLCGVRRFPGGTGYKTRGGQRLRGFCFKIAVARRYRCCQTMPQANHGLLQKEIAQEWQWNDRH